MVQVSLLKFIKTLYLIAIVFSVSIAFVQTIVFQDFETFEMIEDPLTE